MFELKFHQKEGLLERRLSGFWTPDTAKDYMAQLDALIARIKRTHPNFRTLSDSTGMALQSAEVTIALTEGMKRLFAANPGRVAIIAGSVLNKLQIQRGYPFPNVRVFLNEQSARAWLFEETPPEKP